MAVTVTHSTPADGTFSTTGAAAWNADHTVVGTIDVANGGTGANTLTANALLKGNGTSAVSASTLLDDGTNITTTSNLGVNITYPSYKLQVAGSSATTSAVTTTLNVQGGTNLLTYSEQFDNAIWEKSVGGTGVAATVTANAGNAPNGTATADRVQLSLNGGTTTSDLTRLRQLMSLTAGVTYVSSVWIRSYDGVSSYTLHLQDAANATRNITVTGTWTRYEVNAAGVASAYFSVGLRGGQTPTNNNTADILVWGAQVEPGTTASPYVATTSAAVNGTSSAYFGGPVTLASTNRSAAAWTTSGINLIQSAATFTDTTSTGTVAAVYANRFAAQTIAASNTTTYTSAYGTYFERPLAGTNATLTTRVGLGSEGIICNGIFQGSGQFETYGSSFISFTTATTSANLATGVTASGSTKTVNIGTGGASGSTTAITIGSSTSGATQTTTVNGRVTLAPIGASVAAWTTNGVGLVQSAATFTDTTSTGTVTNVYMNRFNAQTLAASNTMTATYLYGTYFSAPAAGTNVTATNIYALGTDSISVAGTSLLSGAVSMTTATSNIGIGTNQTTGVLTLGGSSQTGNINIGSSTVNQTAQFAYGTTASGSTKTVNIGTAGASGSTTNITLGSATSGATQTTTINGQVTLAPIGGSAAAWTTSGIALKQSASTWTDTSSTGTVADIRFNNFAAQTLNASNAVTATRLFNSYFAAPIAGTNVSVSNAYAVGADSFLCLGVTAILSGASQVQVSASTGASNFGTSQTSGTIGVGSTSGTGAITVGQSTANQTVNVHTGVTASGNTKTVNIGTGGASGSTTTISIGSSTSGATSTTTLNGSTVFTGTAQLQGYTVATLPAAGTAGRRAYVTDATAPTWLGALTGGGTVKCPVFDNGTAWIAG